VPKANNGPFKNHNRLSGLLAYAGSDPADAYSPLGKTQRVLTVRQVFAIFTDPDPADANSPLGKTRQMLTARWV